MSIQLNNSGVTFATGSTQTRAHHPVALVAGGSYAANTTYSAYYTGTSQARTVQFFFNAAGIQGGAAGITITFNYGVGALNQSITPVNTGVNYVVYPCPSAVVYSSISSNYVYWSVSTANLSMTGYWVSILVW